MAGYDFRGKGNSVPSAQRLTQKGAIYSPPAAAKRFPGHWSALPVHAKALHALAAASGLVVTHSTDRNFQGTLTKDYGSCFVWMGLADAFRACGLFNRSTNWDFDGWGQVETSEGVRAEMLRAPAVADEGPAIFVLHTDYAPITSRGRELFAGIAQADTAFQSFRARVLEPVPGLVADPSDEDAPILVWLNPAVQADYRARGVFPELANLPVPKGYVSVSVARAIAADAEAQARGQGRKVASKWWMLRSRVLSDLRSREARNGR